MGERCQCKWRTFLRIIAVAATLVLVYRVNSLNNLYGKVRHRADPKQGRVPQSKGKLTRADSKLVSMPQTNEKLTVKIQNGPQTSKRPITSQVTISNRSTNSLTMNAKPTMIIPPTSTSAPSSNPQPFNKRCDDVCRQFKERLSNWPKDKPKGAISYLVQNNDFIGQSLQKLYDNFLKNFSYPVVIFHEKNFRRSALREACKKCEIHFQLVTLEAPPFLNFTIPKRTACSNHSVGYRHMCRFQAKTVYELPMFQGLRYIWRLDDDSNILSPIKYDVFKFMETHHFKYGHMGVVGEKKECIAGLWGNVTEFVAREKFNSSGLKGWQEDLVFYNNFEISEIALWTSEQYKSYIYYLDRAGGIYYYRWGDAPIKTIAVKLFVPKKYVHQFSDINYSHRGWSVEPNKNIKQTVKNV